MCSTNSTRHFERMPVQLTSLERMIQEVKVFNVLVESDTLKSSRHRLLFGSFSGIPRLDAWKQQA
jgi:hypothetical protein